MKRNAIARIIIYSILALVLTCILVSGIAFNGYMFDIGISSGTVATGEISLDADNIRNIEINWACGSIHIQKGDTDKIIISEKAPEDCKHQMLYMTDGQSLALDYGKGKLSFGFGNGNIPSKDLTITVPRNWACETLEIDGAALQITIQELNVGTLELDGASCDLHFSGAVDRVDIDGASTKLHLQCANRTSRIEIDGASCKLDLFLPEGCGFTVSMDGISYGLNTDLPCTNHNGSKVYGDGHCKIDVDGISCEVNISESAECSHEWDLGYPTIEPGSGTQLTEYTCLLCGQRKSETVFN